MSDDPAALGDAAGSTMRDTSGAEIGRVGYILYDLETGRPEWAAVRSPLVTDRELYVPLDGARLEAGEVVVEHSALEVAGSPVPDEQGVLTAEEERQLYEHYGVGHGPADGGTRAGQRGVTGAWPEETHPGSTAGSVLSVGPPPGPPVSRPRPPRPPGDERRTSG